MAESLMGKMRVISNGIEALLPKLDTAGKKKLQEICRNARDIYKTAQRREKAMGAIAKLAK
jgi:hypothetical protein